MQNGIRTEIVLIEVARFILLDLLLTDKRNEQLVATVSNIKSYFRLT